jgi:hypothetical protein
MPNTSQLAPLPETLRPGPSLFSEIIGDDTLTRDEKLLMFEALFVHDAAVTPIQSSGGPERANAARPKPGSQRRTYDRLRTVLEWGIPAAALAALIIARAPKLGDV